MNNDGIKLNMDMSNMSMMNGSAKSISSGKDEDFVTRIDLILPLTPEEIQSKLYEVEYKSNKIKVLIKIIDSKESDPIFNSVKNIQIGTPSESGLPEMLPLEAFTDNRGIYPAVLASIIFPYRIATWVDDSHETGLKMDYDYEAMQITGGPDNNEKIQAILIINRLLESLESKSKKLQYNDITAFTETYFQKGSHRPILSKVNALASKEAYKNSVQEYYLKDFDNSEINNTLQCLHENYSSTKIESEKDLYEIISRTIEDILIHHIENRRWIEPFWDGERKIKIEGKEITVPRLPKKETKIQPTLHVMLDMALVPLGIQVIRESDEGIGSLDFRFLYTTSDKLPLSVGIEFKVAHHKQIKKGITRQLPAYLKSIRSKHGFFVVMWFKDAKYFKEPKKRDKEGMLTYIQQEAENTSSELDLTLSSKLIDASIRPSASTL